MTIVSLDFLVKVLNCGKERRDNQNIREEVKRHLDPTALKMRSYSGKALLIVKKAKDCLSHGCYTVDGCVQVASARRMLGFSLRCQLRTKTLCVKLPQRPVI